MTRAKFQPKGSPAPYATVREMLENEAAMMGRPVELINQHGFAFHAGDTRHDMTLVVYAAPTDTREEIRYAVFVGGYPQVSGIVDPS